MELADSSQDIVHKGGNDARLVGCAGPEHFLTGIRAGENIE